MNDEQAKGTIATWIKSGLLVIEAEYDPKTRKTVDSLSVNDSKRPTE
jgi:hypothetical protein